MVSRPGDVSAEDGELVTQDGVLDLHRFSIARPGQAEEPAEDQVEDRCEHEAATVPMRWSEGESLFWHPSRALYAVNARFGVSDPGTAEYDVVRVLEP
jgi:hypothetical protein